MFPRIKHLRHRAFDRTRHSTRLLLWLSEQATRLGILASQVISLLAVGNTATAIEGFADATVPSNSAVPVVTGTAAVGQVLSASTGTWSGGVLLNYAYQWKAGGVAISGAVSSKYTPVAGDVGKALTVTITASNGKGSASATSAATAAVTA